MLQEAKCSDGDIPPLLLWIIGLRSVISDHNPLESFGTLCRMFGKCKVLQEANFIEVLSNKYKTQLFQMSSLYPFYGLLWYAL